MQFIINIDLQCLINYQQSINRFIINIDTSKCLNLSLRICWIHWQLRLLQNKLFHQHRKRPPKLLRNSWSIVTWRWNKLKKANSPEWKNKWTTKLHNKIWTNGLVLSKWTGKNKLWILPISNVQMSILTFSPLSQLALFNKKLTVFWNN